jgi:hypothetical protein
MHVTTTSPRTPTGSVLAFTFINSLGTGVVTSGIFFLTKSGYGFSDRDNFGLGVLLGIMYIIGSLAAGPLVRWLRQRVGLSSRGVLAVLMLLLAMLCTIPMLTKIAMANTTGGAPVWPIWVMVGLYSPLTGVLWPMVESYLSGGKSGVRLQRAIGVWNVVWSAALIVAYWGVAPFIEHSPAQAILALGATHLVALGILASFGREPAAHLHSEHAPHPKVYEHLLTTFRVLLPVSYVASSALAPYLAGLMPKLGIGVQWSTVVASVWLVPRTLAFCGLGFWSGWHGKWWPVVLAWVCLFAGFLGCVGAGLFAGGDADILALGRLVLVISLALFGVGMGTVYSGAISYAMEVGKAQVDAGGTHEALIGVGYTLGPACGVIATSLVSAGAMPAGGVEPVLLGGVGVIMLLGVGIAWQRVRQGRLDPDSCATPDA